MVWDSPSQWKGFIPTAQMYPIASDYASVVGKPAPELSDNTPVIATPPEEPASDSPAHDHDSEAPSTPGNLRLVSKDYAEINIEWDASTDNIGVDKYKVYRDGVVVATSSGPNLATIFTDITVNPAITYKYRVRALDTVGNESNFSNELSVTTSNSPQPEPDPTPDPEPTPEPEQKLGDLNGDDKVNILDLSVLLSNWNRTTGNLTNDKADLNGDDKVNILDLSVLLSRWGS
jgi:chitodextrinase